MKSSSNALARFAEPLLYSTMRSSRVVFGVATALSALAACLTPLAAQDRGAAGLDQLVRGLTVTARVLVVGAHPEDDDPALIAWLARGRMVETGYLSLTRGEAGQNFVGYESGAVLGAVRTEEMLAARRIDGGEQFFTRAYDFGFAKNTDNVFKQWPHDALLGDVVTVVRSFRPHVLVDAFSEGFNDGNAEHKVLGILVREVYDAAADTVRFPAATFGRPWVPLKLYRHGAGLTIDVGQYDAVLGKTYAQVAAESRAQHRSQGLVSGVLVPQRTVLLARAASRVNDSTPAADEKTLFDGIDTSLVRLVPGAAADVAAAIPLIIAYADSARHALDLAHPSAITRYVARASQLAASARSATPSCRHPSPDAAPRPGPQPACDVRAADLDASIDLVLRRTTDALFAAAGVSFEARADQEFIAEGNATPVTVSMFNHGDSAVILGDVVVSGAPHVPFKPVTIPPDSVGRAYMLAGGLADARPWWMVKRVDELFTPVTSTLDGLARTGLVPDFLNVPGVAIPEGIRRQSDVTVSVTIAGATVSTSIGPITYRSADALLGVQDRAVAGVPAVSLAFERSLQWIRAKKPINTRLRVTMKSFADAEQTFTIKTVAPAGIRLDSLPASVTLAPHEQRELYVHMRGSVDQERNPFGLIGTTATGARFADGFQTVQYPYILPVRIFHSSGVWIQGVNVDVPTGLNVVYVTGVGDDIAAALKQIGIPVAVVSVEDLISVDLSLFTTLVIGPRAYEAHRELVTQNRRFLDFARKGGTLVMLQDQSPNPQIRPLPFSVTLSRPTVPSVIGADIPVTAVDPKARLLNWPNVIGLADWSEWVGQRGISVPIAADPRYTRILEMHEGDEEENRNALLVAPFGKGTIIYTTLTFHQQIPAGVPGALRLFVNLLSAGLPAERAR
jgi:LmbE family N-acetylglucosaminyl deacetylase